MLHQFILDFRREKSESLHINMHINISYQCTKAHDITMPPSWSENELAGVDWFNGFLKCHPQISVRTPEATSLARATAFNKHNVNTFFDKLSSVMDRYSFEASNIWNLDETGLTTVQRPCRVVAQKGVKQVGAVTSGERGELVTLCQAVSAVGNTVPPMFIFPRVNFKDHFIRDGPLGCIGAANKSGWMQEPQFVTFMHHFIKHVRPDKENPVLLLLDNHSSHLSLDAIELERENGIVCLSFPPHTSHRLQPLDRGVYGPLKRYVFSAQDAWMKNNPLRTMTIYDLPAIAREALPKANVPANIINGFKKCGIFPFNRDIFEEHDFAPSSVSDRDLETQNRPVEPVASCSSSTPPAAPEEEALSSQVSNQRMSDKGGVDSSPGNTLQNPVELPQCSNLDRPIKKIRGRWGKTAHRLRRPTPSILPHRRCRLSVINGNSSDLDLAHIRHGVELIALKM